MPYFKRIILFTVGFALFFSYPAQVWRINRCFWKNSSSRLKFCPCFL